MKHLVWKIAATLAGVVALGVAVNTATDRSQDELARTAIELQTKSACRGNVVRAYQIVDAGRNARQPVDRQAAARRLLPIVNCRSGEPLPLAAQDEYIDRVARQMGVDDWNVTR